VSSAIGAILDAADCGECETTSIDYGAPPPFDPIPSFDTKDWGEVIFCNARKNGRPTKRCIAPTYAKEVSFHFLLTDHL
jgi:hypothetical protein